MLLSVFGTPSALMYGGLNLVRNLIELGVGTHKLANANTTDELRKTLADLKLGPEAKVVFYSDLPSADLCALFIKSRIKSRAPIVLFIDNFDDVIGYVRDARDMSFADSARLASRSFCALEPVIRSDLVLKFDARSYRRPVREVLREIAEFFGTKLSEANLDRVVASLIEEAGKASVSDYLFRAFPAAKLPGDSLQRMLPEDRRVVTQLLKPYSAAAAGQSFERIEWPIGMFMDSSDSTRPFSGRVELLGPARFLAYGPYLHLTPGKWCADVVFEIAPARHAWDPRNQRPELWRLFNARITAGELLRVFPLSNWTELDVWDYIRAENIPVVPLYFARPRPVVERNGALIMVDDERLPLQSNETPHSISVRFRTLGCYPLTGAIRSTARTLDAVIDEMRSSLSSERQGRLIDHDEIGSMEKKKREGYF